MTFRREAKFSGARKRGVERVLVEPGEARRAR